MKPLKNDIRLTVNRLGVPPPLKNRRKTMDEIKSGKEILDDFFHTVDEIPGVDNKITAVLKELYNEDKLTTTNLSNALLKLREEIGNEQD